MKTIHLSSCGSTQNVLKDHVKDLGCNDDFNLLISTEQQLTGIGRESKKWFHFEQALAFSFSLKANNKITLTSLEMGVLIANFFKEKYQIEINLKWPNDLINNRGEKCGGILCHNLGDNKVICGVGLNLKASPNEIGMVESPYPIGDINYVPVEANYKESLPKEIVHYIYQHRLNPEQVIFHWTKKCFHMNKVVRIIEQNQESTGKFLGVGEFGEARILLSDTNQEKKWASGTLIVEN